jgi:hypothetical protein
MRPLKKYLKGEVINNCIFLEEKKPIIRNNNNPDKLKFVKRIGLFKCFCGKEFEAGIIYIKNKSIKSCGCLRDSKIKEQGYKNKTHGLRKNPLYQVWKSMIYRCENPNDMNYFRYGARGIKVCNEWKDIHIFIKDMETTYKQGLQLDRKNNDGNYCKENCRWVSRKVNANNTRRNRFIEYNGITKTVGEWADITGIAYATLINRLNSWDLEKVFNTPYFKKKPNKNKII